MTGFIGFQQPPAFQRSGFQMHRDGGDDIPRKRTRRPSDDGHVGWEERFDKEQARKAEIAAARIVAALQPNVQEGGRKDWTDESIILLLLLT